MKIVCNEMLPEMYYFDPMIVPESTPQAYCTKVAIGFNRAAIWPICRSLPLERRLYNPLGTRVIHNNRPIMTAEAEI